MGEGPVWAGSRGGSPKAKLKADQPSPAPAPVVPKPAPKVGQEVS